MAFLGAGAASSEDAAFGYDLDMTLMARNYDDLQSGVQEKDATPITVTLPLEPASGGTFCVRFRVLPVENVSPYSPIFGGSTRNVETFRLFCAIVDTGSLYLVLPSSDADDDEKGILPSSSWLSNSAYPPTEEIYGSVQGQINWKFARYAFHDPLLQVQV